MVHQRAALECALECMERPQQTSSTLFMTGMPCWPTTPHASTHARMSCVRPMQLSYMRPSTNLVINGYDHVILDTSASDAIDPHAEHTVLAI